MAIMHVAERVAHEWAHQAKAQGKTGGNFHFSHATIFSYAQPIGQLRTARTGEVVALLCRGSFSVTTSRHQGIARMAVSHLRQFHVSSVEASTAAILGDFKAQLVAKIRAACKPRILQRTRNRLIDEAREVVESSNEFRRLFAKRYAPLAMPADVEKFARALNAKEQREAQRAVARRIAEEEKRAADLKRALSVWIRGQNLQTLPHPRALEFAYLRISPRDAQTVETSKGAEFPLEHARRAYGILKRVRARGESWHTNGHTIKVGVFQIEALDGAGVVTAGCHRIEWAEVERFASAQRW